jgi:hypothetical protein
VKVLNLLIVNSSIRHTSRPKSHPLIEHHIVDEIVVVDDMLSALIIDHTVDAGAAFGSGVGLLIRFGRIGRLGILWELGFSTLCDKLSTTLL